MPDLDSITELIAVGVGNSRLRFGRFEGADLHDPRSLALDNLDDAAEAIASAAHAEAPIIIASVNNTAADALERTLTDDPALTVYRIGRDLPITINHTLADASTVGHDRLLCAMGAYLQAQQACVVIDAGTAVTVDFIDGQGTFHGGVIAPGASMMLRALHEQTDALPLVEFGPIDEKAPPFGASTPDAILRGVHASIVGLAHHVVEQYASHYDAYPQIIATGGDAPTLFAHDEIIEHIVPDLQLVGIRAACVKALET